MHSHAPQPTARRVASFLWFPFFFAAAFCLIGLYSFHRPAPHDMRVVVTPDADAAAVTFALDAFEAGGFDVTTAASDEAARGAVIKGEAAAAVDGDRVLVSSGASPLRADYLGKVLPLALGQQTAVVDVRPTASGDVSGVSLFFYGLPLLLVGLITSIVLLQLGMWPLSRKLVAIAATGGFTAMTTFLVAIGLDVVPNDPRLLLYGFMLTQAIGWLTTATALNLRQYFMPTAMTFVLVLGIPSSGGTVSGDMLPTPVGWLNDVLPFAAFIDAVRASAYASGAGLTRPLLVLASWAALGAGLLAWTSARAKRAAVAARLADPREAVETATCATKGPARLRGRITTLSEHPVAHAFVSVLDESGEEIVRTTTNADGDYEVRNLASGLHHVVVTARHCEPEIVTVALHADEDRPRDIALQSWTDPAANLSADEVGARLRMTGMA
jgi:hypothetical protein